MAKWTTSDIPPQKGRSAVVTGAGGLGFESALELARAGGEVIIASRNPQKGLEAIAKIRAQAASATVRFEQVDLACLKSVADFAARLRSQRTSLDLLINNAGVMTPPDRQTTSDGFELQPALHRLNVRTDLPRSNSMPAGPGHPVGRPLERWFARPDRARRLEFVLK